MKWLVHYWEGNYEDFKEFKNEIDAKEFADKMNEEYPYCGAFDPEQELSNELL